jgi:hypothetical protein
MRHDTPTGPSLGLSEDHGTLRVMAWATRSRRPLARFVSVRLGVDELLGHALSTHPEVAEELLHPTVTTSCRASDF